MNQNFISKVLETVGYLSAFAVAFSQYILRDSFKSFFEVDPKIYSVSSLFAMMLSVVIIIAIFTNRYIISSKMYFRKKSKDDYYSALRQNTNAQGQLTGYVTEPRSFTLKQIALILLGLSVILFFIFIKTANIDIRGLTYILIVTAIVGSVTIYATGLYLENDWQQREKDKKELILSKIKEYFAGDIKICASWRDDSNAMSPIHRMIIERNGQKFNIYTNANDPERLFTVDPVVAT